MVGKLPIPLWMRDWIDHFIQFQGYKKGRVWGKVVLGRDLSKVDDDVDAIGDLRETKLGSTRHPRPPLANTTAIDYLKVDKI